MTVNERLEALRAVMKREHLGAFIFPSTDPHNGEYVPDHWKGREWISGFNGSAGTAVVTMTSAALWTDSRYFLAAADQLSGTGFQLMKLKVEGTPSIAQWIAQEVSLNRLSTEVGIDGSVLSTADVEDLISDLRMAGGITLRTNLDPLAQIWTNRPPVPQNRVEVHPLQYAGESAQSKLDRIRRQLLLQHADGMLVAALDDIAWTLNLRGSDVHCNPVFVSYLLITSQSAMLFVDAPKLTAEVEVYLHSVGVSVFGYDEVRDALQHYPDYSLLFDPNEINYSLSRHIKCPNIVRAASPVPVMKAVKNATEIQGFHNAMLKDGIAMVKFLSWLQPAVEKGGETEMSVDQKLTSLRSEQPGFRDISFDTIAAYQDHGAIVHYEATPDTDAPLRPEGLLLLDSGAQYLDGTTDITRTIALGPVTPEQKRIYTLVLKAHIGLQLAKFPDGCSGTQIDALARISLWREGLNFMHGTGHGVGSYLNVHEGPHQVRQEWKPTPLHAGMTVTDEPGVYLPGRFGVRIENLLLIQPYQETEFGRFLQMQTLTLCPYDLSPLLPELLTAEERLWLNNYHQVVRDTLTPHLTPAEQQWLQNNTQPI